MGHIRALDTQETNTQEDSIEESNYALTSRISDWDSRVRFRQGGFHLLVSRSHASLEKSLRLRLSRLMASLRRLCGEIGGLENGNLL